ncbi:MAG: hypothetical protein ACHRHE_06905 [Tepidisphaerales bacterium]
MNQHNSTPPPLPIPADVPHVGFEPGGASFAAVRFIAVAGVATGLAGLVWGATWFRAHGTPNVVQTFYRTSALASIPLDLLLLAGSIGILCRRKSGRRALLWWAGLAGAYALARLFVVILWAGPAATAVARAAGAGKPPGEFGPDFAGMMMVLAGVAVWGVTTILPVLVVIVLTGRAKWGQRPRWP